MVADRGNDWRRGLWRRIRRHTETRDIVIIALLLLNFLFTAAYQDHSHAAELAQQQAAQRGGKLVEERICATISQLAALHPPAGNPHMNPSRAYDQELHATLDGLGPDLGCR